MSLPLYKNMTYFVVLKSLNYQLYDFKSITIRYLLIANFNSHSTRFHQNVIIKIKIVYYYYYLFFQVLGSSSWPPKRQPMHTIWSCIAAHINTIGLPRRSTSRDIWRHMLIRAEKVNFKHLIIFFLILQLFISKLIITPLILVKTI